MDNRGDYLRPASTITDAEFVRAIATLRKPAPHGYHWVLIGEMSDWFNIHPNRIRSKLRRTRRRRLVDGCNCGCRGDLELMPAGERLLLDNATVHNTHI